VSKPVVDIHAHALVPAAARLADGHPGLARDREQEDRQFGTASIAVNAELFAGQWLAPLTDLDTRLAAMDAVGVDIQVVSATPTQYYYWADAGLAERIVETVNGGLADLVAAAPGRLAGLGTVALQHPRLAVRQLVDAVERFGMRGVEISTTAGGRDFSHADLEPFWATAADLGVLLFVHPWGCDYGDRLARYYLGNTIGQPLETTVALSHLICSGVLERHPTLKVCGAHGGGYLPQYIGRADHAWAVRPESRTTPRPPSHYLTQLYFDSLVYRADTLRGLLDAAGPTHVLLGTDYPFDMADPDQRTLLEGLDGAARTAVAGANAAALLGLRSSTSALRATPTR